MNQGCLIFAYDGDVAYGPQAVLAARLVAKHLGVPVSLVTDTSTYDKISQYDVFDQVFLREVDTANSRVLYNGPNVGNKVIWKNVNRSSAYDITPYDRTLVIDSDFLVFSNRLKEYLDSNYDFMICENMRDLCPDRKGSRVMLDPVSIPMLWATNIIFNKTPEVEALFNLVDHIRENWLWYGALYKFDTTRFRNDYAFSIACHSLSGFGIEKFHGTLPSPVFFTDKDLLVKLAPTGLTFMMHGIEEHFVKTKGEDLHIMNKHIILENFNQLMELADVR
jgi:hypothetical protein